MLVYQRTQLKHQILAARENEDHGILMEVLLRGRLSHISVQPNHIDGPLFLTSPSVPHSTSMKSLEKKRMKAAGGPCLSPSERRTEHNKL